MKLAVAVAFPLRLNVMIAKTREAITQNTGWHSNARVVVPSFPALSYHVPHP